MTEKAVEAFKIKKKYPKSEYFALNGITFTLNAGRILSILGPNGAGKTTLIKILTTQLKKTSGKAKIFGYDLDYQVNKIRPLIGYVGHNAGSSLYIELTGRQNLIYFAGLYGISRKEAFQKISELERYFNVNFLDIKVCYYSWGMRQIVSIMRSLLHDPAIIFLDEPTAGLDIFNSMKLREMIKQYSKMKEKTVVIATHNLYEAEILSDEVIILNKGVLIEHDVIEKIKDKIGYTIFKIKTISNYTNKIIDKLKNENVFLEVLAKENNEIVAYIEKKRKLECLKIIALKLDDLSKYILDFKVVEPSLEDVLKKLLKGEYSLWL